MRAFESQSEPSEDGRAAVRRQVVIEASPEEVWEALVTEEGRGRWIEADPERELYVELADEPGRLVWWWWHGEEDATRVELLVLPAPSGTRVIVTETAPSFPLATLACSFALVTA